MLKKIIFLAIILIIFLIPNVNAEPRIDVKCFFSYLKEDNKWSSWINCTKNNENILTDLKLKIYQPLRCKTIITPFYEGTLGFYITEPGVTEGFTIKQGNIQNKLISNLIIKKEREQEIYNPYNFKIYNPEEKIEYIWYFHPNENWTNGHAPINLFYQFDFPTKNSPYSGEIISSYVGFANPYIKNEFWDGMKTNQIINENIQINSIPFINITFYLLAVLLFFIIKKYR